MRVRRDRETEHVPTRHLLGARQVAVTRTTPAVDSEEVLNMG